MKYSKILNFGNRIMLLSITFNVIESIYFAWDTPGVLFHTKDNLLSDVEMLCDKISSYGLWIGFILYLLPLFELYRNAVKKLDKNG